MKQVAVVGQRARAELRARGEDPASSLEVRRRMGVTMSQRWQEAKAWEKSRGRLPDPQQFRREILPLIKDVSLTKMMRATGLSRSYLSGVRWGHQVPHPRHWEALRALGEEDGAI